LPLYIRVRQDLREKTVGACEYLGLALEVHLPVLVEVFTVNRRASVKDWVEPVAIRAVKIKRHQVVNLRRSVNLIAVERGREIVKFVWIGLFCKARGAVIVGECLLNGIAVVHEVEYEYGVFLRMCAIQSRERLDCLDAREHLVHVHRVKKWFVVAGLELVRADKQPIGIFLNLVGDLARWKPIERGFSDFPPAVLVLTRERDDRPVWTLALDEMLADRVVVLDRPFDTARNPHRPRLTANFVKSEYLLVELINHNLGLEPNRVVVAFNVAPELFLRPLGVELGISLHCLD